MTYQISAAAYAGRLRPKPGGYSTKFYMGMQLCHNAQPLTLLYTIFAQKRYPFHLPSIDKWYLFHVPKLELCISFNCCKCTVSRQNQNIFLTFSVPQNGPVSPFYSPKRQISLPFHWYLNFWNPYPFIYLKTKKGTPFESCSQSCGIFWVCCHILPVYINLHCLKELIGFVTKIFIKIQRVGADTKLSET